MNDLISRQAAIDALDEQIELCDKSLSSFDISMKDEYAVKVERASLVAFRETLEYLPSAESKRKRYRHYKGGIYEVICEAAHHTESLECLVIYRNVKTGEIWARPDWMFYGYTEDGTKRFEEVSE